MFLEQRSEYASEHEALGAMAPKIGCHPDTLRGWVQQHQRDNSAGDGGLSTAERQRLKELEREVHELRRSNDILRQASAYFAKAEFDRLWKK
jgi:transposase